MSGGVWGWVDDSSSDDSQAMTDRAGSQGSLAASLMSAINLRSDNKLANISTLNKLLTNWWDFRKKLGAKDGQPKKNQLKKHQNKNKKEKIQEPHYLPIDFSNATEPYHFWEREKLNRSCCNFRGLECLLNRRSAPRHVSLCLTPSVTWDLKDSLFRKTFFLELECTDIFQ